MPTAGSLLLYFLQLIPRVSLLVFLLVSAAIDDENYCKYGYGIERLPPYFGKHFRSSLKILAKNEFQPSNLLVFLLASGNQTIAANFRYSERRNRADGPQERWRGRQPKADLIDVDCRAARPKFHIGD